MRVGTKPRAQARAHRLTRAAHGLSLVERAGFSAAQQLRRLGDVGGDAPRLVCQTAVGAEMSHSPSRVRSPLTREAWPLRA